MIILDRVIQLGKINGGGAVGNLCLNDPLDRGVVKVCRASIGGETVPVVNADCNVRALCKRKALHTAEFYLRPDVGGGAELGVDRSGISLVNHLVLSAVVRGQCLRSLIPGGGKRCVGVVAVFGTKLAVSKIVISAVVERTVYEIRLVAGIGRKHKSRISAGSDVFGIKIKHVGRVGADFDKIGVISLAVVVGVAVVVGRNGGQRVGRCGGGIQICIIRKAYRRSAVDASCNVCKLGKVDRCCRSSCRRGGEDQ